MGRGVDAFNLVNGRKEKELGRKKGRETPSLILSSSWLSCTTCLPCLPFGHFSLQSLLSQRHFAGPAPWATCRDCYSIVGLGQREWPPTSRQDLWVHILWYVPHQTLLIFYIFDYKRSQEHRYFDCGLWEGNHSTGRQFGWWQDTTEQGLGFLICNEGHMSSSLLLDLVLPPKRQSSWLSVHSLPPQLTGSHPSPGLHLQGLGVWGTPEEVWDH